MEIFIKAFGETWYLDILGKDNIDKTVQHTTQSKLQNCFSYILAI